MDNLSAFEVFVKVFGIKYSDLNAQTKAQITKEQR